MIMTYGLSLSLIKDSPEPQAGSVIKQCTLDLTSMWPVSHLASRAVMSIISLRHLKLPSGRPVLISLDVSQDDVISSFCDTS